MSLKAAQRLHTLASRGALYSFERMQALRALERDGASDPVQALQEAWEQYATGVLLDPACRIRNTMPEGAIRNRHTQAAVWQCLAPHPQNLKRAWEVAQQYAAALGEPVPHICSLYPKKEFGMRYTPLSALVLAAAAAAGGEPVELAARPEQAEAIWESVKEAPLDLALIRTRAPGMLDSLAPGLQRRILREMLAAGSKHEGQTLASIAPHNPYAMWLEMEALGYRIEIDEEKATLGFKSL